MIDQAHVVEFLGGGEWVLLHPVNCAPDVLTCAFLTAARRTFTLDSYRPARYLGRVNDRGWLETYAEIHPEGVVDVPPRWGD